MKHLSGKKLLSCALSLALAVSLTAPALAYDAYGSPQAAMEITNPSGRMVTYTDIDGGKTTDRTDTSDEVDFYKTALTKTGLFEEWLFLAYNIFESNEHTWMDLAGNGWDEDYGQGHYMDFLYDMQNARSVMDYDGSNYGMRSSGLTLGSSLRDAQYHAAKDVAEMTNRDVTAEDIMKHHKMDLIDDTPTQSDVLLYATASVLDQKGGEQRFYYSAFGLVFYDFQLHVISDENPVQGQVTSKSSTPTQGQVVLAENYNYDAFEDTAELTVSTEQTVSSSITNSESYSFGQQVGGSFSLEKKTKTMDLGFEVNLGFDYGQTLETAHETGTSQTIGTNSSTSMSVNVPGHTKFMGEQSITTSTATTAFDCPIGISYKVAIFSMNGDFYDDGAAILDFTGRYAQTSFITLFGSHSSAPDAMESLYQRAMNHREDAGYDETYGDTWLHSYEGGTNGPHYLDWETIFTLGTPQSKSVSHIPYTMDTVKTLATTYPMSLTGAQLSITETAINTKLNTAMPLYPIQDVYLNWQINRAFQLETGETMDFNAYRVRAYDKDFVEYYGFMPYTGTWKLVNAAGEPVDHSPVGHMEYDPVTLEQNFVADAPGTVYVKYFIPEDTYYTWDGVESTNDTINSSAYKIIVSPSAPAPAFEGTLTLAGTGAAVVDMKDNLNNLDYVVTAHDPTGVEVEPDYTWRAQETVSKGIEVQPDGTFIVTKPGTFHVRVECGDIYSNWVELVATESVQLVLGTMDHTFRDVAYADWYNAAVGYVFQNGLMNGVQTKLFSPNTEVTRAMPLQVLYRLSGETVTADSPFADVPNDAWYAQAVTWAADQGLAKGDGTNFSPNAPVTREQLAAFLHRYADWADLTLPTGGDSLSDFTDADTVSHWAKESMEAIVAADLLNGSDGKLAPTDPLLRAQLAQVLMNWLAEDS